MFGRLRQVAQSHFFKMTSRTAPLLSDKKADPERSACLSPEKEEPPQDK